MKISEIVEKLIKKSIGEGGKQEMLIYCNKNKGDTDIFDKLCLYNRSFNKALTNALFFRNA